MLWLMSSCASGKLAQQSKEQEKTIKRLQTDSLRLSQKVDSLNKELKTALKQITQLNEKDKEKRIPALSRRKVDMQDYDRISMFVYNISKYVDWRSDITGPHFVIGVIGDQGVYKKIKEQFQGKKIADKPVIVKLLDATAEMEKADIYYVSHTKMALLSDIRKKAYKTHSLVLSDTHQSTDGVHIHFFVEGDSLRFEMNEEEIKKSKLVMSSQLKNLQK
jgi:hypothetical protein